MILRPSGASGPSKHGRHVLRIIWADSGKFHPCARPCAVLVQCLERLVHLDFARGAHCGKQISGTIKPTQPPVHMLWAEVSEKMMQWRGGFRMLFVVFHRFSQGFHGSRALKNTMNSSTFHLVEANITNFFGGCLAAKHKSF